MPSLHEIQTGFARALLSGDGRAFGPRIIEDAFPGSRRLQVYRNNMLSSLKDALADIYPVLAKLVGEGFFRYAAHQYVGAHPARSGNLHDFGEHFAGFLSQFEPAREHPYLPDVAVLEWAWHQVFHAPDHAPLDLERLGAVAPERYSEIRFTLHPASRLVHSRYPVFEIWETNRGEGRDQDTVDLSSGGDSVLVVRPALEVLLHRLTKGEFALLSAMSDHKTFDEACAAALEAEPNLDVTSCVRKHVLGHAVVDFSA